MEGRLTPIAGRISMDQERAPINMVVCHVTMPSANNMKRRETELLLLCPPPWLERQILIIEARMFLSGRHMSLLHQYSIMFCAV